MRVLISGFGSYTDILRVQTYEHASYLDISGILNIAGVSFYEVQAGIVGVRYSRQADVKDVAAQTLRVLADALDISIEEFVVLASDQFRRDIDFDAFADEVWQRACVASTPERVPAHRIDIRGRVPGYWLLP